MKTYIVKAFWDNEAKVWCAEGMNFIGLATFGESLDHLMKKLEVMIPELIEANDNIRAEMPFELLVESCVLSQRAYA